MHTPGDEAREVIARRLRAQDYIAETAADPATGANMALEAPPAAFIRISDDGAGIEWNRVTTRAAER